MLLLLTFIERRTMPKVLKVLSIVLVLYALVAGLLIPLKSGITEVSPRRLETGEPGRLTVTTYNAGLSEAKAFRAWLRIGRPAGEGERDTLLAAQRMERVGQQQLAIDFDLPRYLPTSQASADASLIVDLGSGAFVQPAAVALTEPPGLSGPRSSAGWDDSFGELSVAQGWTFPFRGILYETIRNTYYHVSLWFALMFIMAGAAIQAVRYLVTKQERFDRRSRALTEVGLIFGLLGLVTGMVWAKYTWGAAWSGDVKQNMTAIALLIYGAYFLLLASVRSPEMAARLLAAYNIFAFMMLIPLLYIIPRMQESLHPGAGGNPGFGGEDLDNTMRAVFYPAILGFTLLGYWMAELSWRAKRVRSLVMERLYTPRSKRPEVANVA